MTNRQQNVQHVIDATGQVLGRLATQIAVLLQGKNTPAYLPREIGSNVVVIKNAKKIIVTGNKAKDKVYYHHTGYMGHLREKKYKEVVEKNPGEALRLAVFNMLPKNFIRQKRMNRLKIEA